MSSRFFPKERKYTKQSDLGHYSPLFLEIDFGQCYTWGFPVAQRLKCLPAMRGTWVQSLGQEDPLEKEMATHSSILAWRIPWTEEPGGLQSTGLKESDTTEQIHFHFHAWKVIQSLD